MDYGKYTSTEKEYEMKKIVLLALITIMVIIISLGCASTIRYDGPYEGRVIDVDTGEPIEGVVVLGEWSREHITPGGAVSEYYDARETVTDKNGEFSIPGQGLLIASNVTPMKVLIFKAGYEYLKTTWLGLKVDGILRQRVKWEGDKAIIPLKKLTMEERKKRGSPPDPPIEAEFEKVRKMLKEIDEDRLKRGLDPRDIWRGEKI
jgi:hypothetical protein